MKRKGSIYENEIGFLLPEDAGITIAQVTRLNSTFGFVKEIESGIEYFVAGKFLKGAMPGDTVVITTFVGRDKKVEAQVVAIKEEKFSSFTGIITRSYYGFVVVPDILPKYELVIDDADLINLSVGDKVIAKITNRGYRHSEHRCVITQNLGSAQKASTCAAAIIEVNGITHEFPLDVIDQAKAVSDYSAIQKEKLTRDDLTDLDIFTIDGADTKDIDDAVYLTKDEKYYNLSVHIADVSYYVKAKTPLDMQALERGTSVYYANKVVPMLPKELSNGICSLNPKEDRLAFSCFMKIDFNGKLVDFDFKKTVIHSKVQGVYSEINAILKGEASVEINQKYQNLLEQIKLMEELALILIKNKKNRGAPDIESTESKLILDKNDICVDVIPHERGFSEEIIENFMLMANESAAKFSKKYDIPFV